jgi:Uma2 family endonuclease
MTGEPRPLTTLTFEEYLKFEELSEERHEFVAGTVFVTSGSTEAHDLTAQVAAYALLPSLRGYLIVDPDWEQARLGRRTRDGWLWYQYGPGLTVDLDGVPLDLGEIFDEVRETRVSE